MAAQEIGVAPPQRRTGLIVVHGIGNQPPGRAAERVAQWLSDESAPEEQGASVGDVPVRAACVHGEEVAVCEAHWASESHPDNPPRVNNALGILPELIRSTMGGIRVAARPQEDPEGGAGLPELLYFVYLLVLIAVPPADLILDFPADGFVIWAWRVLFAGLCVHSVWYVIRRRYLLGNGKGMARLGYWVGDLVRIVLRPFLSLIAAGSILMLLVMTAIALPVNVLGMAAAWLFRAVGWPLTKVRLGWVARWVHRLGWMVVVMPVNSYLQVLKAFVTLLSIALSDASLRLRVRALLMIPAIGAAFWALFLLCWWLIMVPTAIIFVSREEMIEDPESLILNLVVIALFAGTYFLAVRLFLPVLDLLLDVSNYHLASSSERSTYFGRLDDAVSHLEEAGYNDLHILAHSLGTVLVFDWLKQRSPSDPPIASLHTIGSPLEKFWFVDYEGERRRDATGLEGCVERSWTNYWAASDPVSGRLKCFDGPGLKVRNRRMRWLGAILLSHVAYWKRDEVIESLRQELRHGAE